MRTMTLFLALGVAAQASTWRETEEGFVWRNGDSSITLTAKGALEIRGANDTRVTFAFFQWHDAYVYERLERGTPDAPPRIDADGALHLQGIWGARDSAPPLRYELILAPGNEGVDLTLKASKTAELKLRSGIWCAIETHYAPEQNRRIYSQPGPCRPLGSPLGGVSRQLFLELAGEKAFVVDGPGFRTFRSKPSPGKHLVEMCLNPADFAVGGTSETRLGLTFAPMPENFPGAIQPGSAALAIAGVRSPQSVALYGTVELEVDLQATWDNPFDPADVALDATVTLPSGKSYDMPGFFTVDQERIVEQHTEMMVPQGNGRWLVRLAATELGPLRCELRAKDRKGTVTKTLPPIAVSAGPARGFVRRSPVDSRQLAFDNGEGYLPIGHNLPIYPLTGQLADEALRKMADAGENYNRWWMSNSGLGLEWEEKLGWYRQAESARIDFVLDLAKSLGFHYMMCMDTHQDFRKSGWTSNPFNAVNGGPCKTVEEWFTNPTAREFYKKRLRYTVARWAASPHILAWEFGNEFEGWADCDRAALLDWHREMSDYLAGIDPYDHLITTSWWGKTGPEEFWRLPHIDIVQTHCYTNDDANVAEALRDYCLHQWTTFEKPHIFGEFGIRSHSTTADKDPDGRALHNAYWACLASGACGNAMPWWHGNYIDPLDLYFHFTAVRRFTADLPYGRECWRQLEVESLDYLTKPDIPEDPDIRLRLVSGFRKRKTTEFHVQGDGTVSDATELLNLLHGGNHTDLKAPPTFVVTYPVPGQFALTVERVSKSGQLRILLDGACVLDRALPCGEGHGKSWQHRPQWDLWESVYNEEVVVDVPAGEHRITLENLGGDWIRLSNCEFRRARTEFRPNVLIAGLAADSAAFVWVQNRKSSWYNHHTRKDVPPALPIHAVLKGFRDGRYRLEWWETWKGSVVRTETVDIADGCFALTTEAIPTDFAIRLLRQGE